jgi:hypothetical protein
MEALRPEPQARATDTSPEPHEASLTPDGPALLGPLSCLFRDRTHRAANRLDRARLGCGGVRCARVGSTAALFQMCDRPEVIHADLGKDARALRVAKVPRGRLRQRHTNAPSSARRRAAETAVCVRTDCARARSTRTNHGCVLITQQLRPMCALGLDKWMCVGDYRDSLDGTIAARCERHCAEQLLLIDATADRNTADRNTAGQHGMVGALPAGTRIGGQNSFEKLQGARRRLGVPFARNSSVMTSCSGAD